MANSAINKKYIEQSYLNRLREEFEISLWCSLHQKALIAIGIHPAIRLPSSLKENTNNTNNLAGDFGHEVVGASAGILTDFVTLKQPDLLLPALKIGLIGAMWLGEVVGDKLTSLGDKLTSAEYFYSKSIEHFKNKNYQESINSINKAISKNKQCADAFCLRGYIYSDLGYFKEAIEDLNQAISISPHYIDAYKKRASVNYALGNYEKAIEDDNFLILQQVDDSVAHFRRGMSYIALKFHEKAIEYFTASIRANPSNILGYLIRGYIFLSSFKNLNEAVQDFNYVIKIEANCAEAYLGCAKAYEELEEYDKAIRYYSKIINNASDSYSKDRFLKTAYVGRCFSHLCYALSYAKLGLHQNAIKHFSHADNDYWSSKLGNKSIHKEIVEERCLSYISLNKRWNARLDALKIGLKSTKIKELRLKNWEKIFIAILVLIIPTILFNGAFSNLSRLSVASQITESSVKNLDRNKPVKDLQSNASIQTIDFDGGRYLGDVVSGQANGKGSWTHSNGSHLEGQFRNNQLIDGEGVIFGDDYRYEGSFKNGMKSGRGVVILSDGRHYEGNFENNNPNGLGVTIFADRTRYEGEHRDGNLDGKGKLLTPDGIQWIGEFKDGKQDGKLVVTAPNGKSVNVICVRGDCKPDKHQ